MQADFRSDRRFAVKPAPVARREAALSWSARHGRAHQVTALTAHLRSLSVPKIRNPRSMS